MKFIYVFGLDARNDMLSLGYELIKGDESASIYVFENSHKACFELDELDIPHVLSNVLTF